MASYEHILVAVELTDEAAQVLDKALSLRGKHTRVSLIHVIEPLTYAYGGDLPIDLAEIQDQLNEHAEKHLSELNATRPETLSQHVYVGRVNTEIHRFADEHQVDLIVVGSHGRHGLSLLLGSTADGVLHGAHCDVLAVRVHSTDEG